MVKTESVSLKLSFDWTKKLNLESLQIFTQSLWETYEIVRVQLLRLPQKDLSKILLRKEELTIQIYC